jgi:hypothetical protein
MTDPLEREKFERENPNEAELKRQAEKNEARAEHVRLTAPQMSEEDFDAKQKAEKEEFMKKVSQSQKSAEDFQAEQNASREEHQQRTSGATTTNKPE